WASFRMSRFALAVLSLAFTLPVVTWFVAAQHDAAAEISFQDADVNHDDHVNSTDQLLVARGVDPLSDVNGDGVIESQDETDLGNWIETRWSGTPMPTTVARHQQPSGWSGQYFANPYLSGAPVIARDYRAI